MVEWDHKVAKDDFDILGIESNRHFLKVKENLFIKEINHYSRKISTLRNYFYFRFINFDTEI